MEKKLWEVIANQCAPVLADVKPSNLLILTSEEEEVFLQMEELPANVVKRVMRTATPETRKLINQYLHYPENSAGSIMTAEFIDLKKYMSVRESIARIRRIGEDKETIYICFVTSADRKLEGIVTVKDLLLAEDDTVIENLMDKVDNLILCGGMTFTFAKAQGGKIGNSICEDDKLQLALDIIAKAKAKGVNLVLGTDCVAADAFSNDANTQICPVNDIPDGWEGMDAGPASRKAFAAAIEGAKTILWNGPAGVFEFDKFAEGSRAIAEAIAKATAEGAFSLIGGGDSVACINKFGMADQVSYISTGGGALLEAIEGKELPGVAAICKK